ncbi:MAG: polymer-forming cytoskeletal protein [Nitrospinae bacterium]|nr:polymer-forming cytoskeletal protein [Nitrospinota bacterium]
MSFKKEQSQGHIRAFLGEGTEFEGILSFDGTVRVDGRFKGEVNTTDCLIIGETGVVEGEINAGHFIVMGTFSGNIKALRKVEVLSTGKITGDVVSPALVVQEGGHLDGKIVMNGILGQQSGKVLNLVEARQDVISAKPH